MSELALKEYQVKALDALSAFLTAARGQCTIEQMQAAFDRARREVLGEAAPELPYHRFSEESPELPIACLRVPTGGGKTLMAAHAIERAARLYVGTTAPLALWLVPSNAIRTQTLEALKTPGHPYREALLGYWPDDRLTVIDIADCEQLRAQDFGSRAIVVVGTLQTLRVENTTGREVYAYKEYFEPHFAAAPDAAFFERVSERDLEAQPYLGRADLGRIKRSFANLLAWHRPIVIMDEAHNAQSSLSLEVLKRIRPACVVEWTATPAKDQNLLYHVSAQELKAAHMIKLPIVLAPHPNWQESVRDAVLTRDVLAREATAEPDYVRPIVLFQADQRGNEATVEVLKAFLLDTLHIEERRIAVATGNQRELDGVNLFDRACAVDFVITVEALKEGWDCSFAYVFCTVQNIRSAKDMEQLLGRVLRMPYAQRRVSEKLNRAYAHVCGAGTAQVANQLADRLVTMGFEEMEVAQFVQPSLDADLFAERPTAAAPVESVFDLPLAVAHAVAADPAGTGEGRRGGWRGPAHRERPDRRRGYGASRCRSAETRARPPGTRAGTAPDPRLDGHRGQRTRRGVRHGPVRHLHRRGAVHHPPEGLEVRLAEPGGEQLHRRTRVRQAEETPHRPERGVRRRHLPPPRLPGRARPAADPGGVRQVHGVGPAEQAGVARR